MNVALSNEMEQSALGALLLDNSAIDRMPDLLPEHFAIERHRVIFSAIQSELLAGKVADVITVFEQLRRRGHNETAGGLPYLNALAQSVPSARNAKRYAEVVQDQHKARLLAAAGERITALAMDETKPLDDRIDLAASELAKLTDTAAEVEASSLAELMVLQIDALEEMAEHGDRSAIATGIPELDARLCGGLRPGDLVILGGRPSMGKTAAGLTVALNIAAREPVGFWSGEMTKAQLTQRAIAQLGRVDLGMVMQPNRANDEFWARVCDATERVQSMRLFIDDRPGLTFPQLRAKARAMNRRHGIKLLVVDYLQLMNGTDPKLSRNYQLEEISRGLKALAKQLGIPILALAQVNRDVGDSMPGMRDLRDSGAIEQDADIIAFVHRPIVCKPDLGEEWKHYAQMFVAKLRQGEIGLIDLAYIGRETRFASWDGPKPQTSGGKPGAARRSRTGDIDF